MPRCGGGAPHCKGLKRNCCSAFGRDSSAASCWGSGFTEDRCCTPENAECFPAGSSLRYSDCCPNADCWADGLTFESPLRSPGIRGAEESFKCETLRTLSACLLCDSLSQQTGNARELVKAQPARTRTARSARRMDSADIHTKNYVINPPT